VPFRDGFDRVAEHNTLLFVGWWFGKHGEEIFRGFRALGVSICLRPEYRSRVTDPDPVSAVAVEQSVQTSRVAEGGTLRNGGVRALFLPEGSEGILVERHDGRSRGLGAQYAFDFRMEARHRKALAGYEAEFLTGIFAVKPMDPDLSSGVTVVEEFWLILIGLDLECDVLPEHVCAVR